jgi:hypothetical protein
MNSTISYIKNSLNIAPILSFALIYYQSKDFWSLIGLTLSFFTLAFQINLLEYHQRIAYKKRIMDIETLAKIISTHTPTLVWATIAFFVRIFALISIFGFISQPEAMILFLALIVSIFSELITAILEKRAMSIMLKVTSKKIFGRKL